MVVVARTDAERDLSDAESDERASRLRGRLDIGPAVQPVRPIWNAKHADNPAGRRPVLGDG